MVQHQPGTNNNKATSHLEGEGGGGRPTRKMCEKKKGHTEILSQFFKRKNEQAQKKSKLGRDGPSTKNRP